MKSPNTPQDVQEKTEAGPLRRGLSGLRAALPKGRPLPDAHWHKRHRTILALLWMHAIGLTIFGIFRGVGLVHSLAEGTAVAFFAVAASVGDSRRRKAVLASVGILSASAVLVHLSGGTIEAHFHFFVMVPLISLYQDWTPFLLAVSYVVVHHGTVGVFDPESVYNHEAAIANPWLWAGIHGLFILGACAVSLVAWRLNEDAQARAEEYYRRLYEGEKAVVGELREAQRMKDELIAMVSHELRTPLTAIIGFGQTLTDYWEKLSSDERQESLDSSLRQAHRLRRHVENLLEAARVSERVPDASADLGEAVNTVLDELTDTPDDLTPTIDARVSPVDVALSSDALHLVVVNLIGNALKYANPDTVVGVTAGPAGPQAAFLSVTNVAPPISQEDVERIFQPFVQLDSSATRTIQGMGLGLHIVRRVVDLYEGSVNVAYADGCITFRAEFPTSAILEVPAVGRPSEASNRA